MDSSPRIQLPTEAVRAARQHLTVHFGKPVSALAFRGAQRSLIEVGVFEAARSAGSTRAGDVASMFATAGAAQLRSDAMPREWIFCVTTRAAHSLLVDDSREAPLVSHSAVAELVARIAADAPEVGRVLRAPLDLDVGFSSMRQYVLFPAWPLKESQRSFRRRDGAHVELGWIVPVHAGEAELARRESATALWKKFAEANTDLLDLNRPSIDVDA
jgi:hypothetical protein